ncbi:hydrogenase formation protein HypD [Bacteroidota bacterium]
MKFVDEFRNRDLVEKLSRKIHEISTKNVTLMEVCGGHTMAIQKYGIPSLLPENIRLLSGPGCPVCVTDISFIDKAIYLSNIEDFIITTYGDLIRVPGSHSTLEKQKARGSDIRIVYSTMEALSIAKKNKDKKVVFLSIGFETTTPASAIAILEASKQGLTNFYMMSAHKLIPPAMEALIAGGISIDAFIGPGHVSTIGGSIMYDDLHRKHKIAIVISGFEPLDILSSIYLLVQQIENNQPAVQIQYSRAVNPRGNQKAKTFVGEVFETKSDRWRGLGEIKNSGLGLKSKYEKFDAEKSFRIKIGEPVEPKGCICGEILKGLKNPLQCKLFRTVCNPSNPVGACMVSNEGACQAYYRYN